MLCSLSRTQKPQSKHASAALGGGGGAAELGNLSLVRALWHATQFEFTDGGAAVVRPNAAMPRLAEGTSTLLHETFRVAFSKGYDFHFAHAGELLLVQKCGFALTSFILLRQRVELEY